MDKVNGSAQQMQVTPADAARYALQFLQRVSMTPNERGTFALAESLLQAIASGQVAIAAPAAELAEPREFPGVQTS